MFTELVVVRLYRSKAHWMKKKATLAGNIALNMTGLPNWYGTDTDNEDIDSELQ